MKIKLLTGMAGVTTSYRPGEIIDVDDAEGLRHIASGNAVPADAPAPAPTPTADAPESAAVDPADETATQPGAAPRKAKGK